MHYSITHWISSYNVSNHTGWPDIHVGSLHQGGGDITNDTFNTWTIWPPFCRVHSQVHFRNAKFMHIEISLIVIPEGRIDNTTALVLVTVQHQTDANPLPWTKVIEVFRRLIHQWTIELSAFFFKGKHISLDKLPLNTDKLMVHKSSLI